MRIFLLLFLFTQVIIADWSPNGITRNPAVRSDEPANEFYTIIASDVNNESELAETEDFLKSLSKDVTQNLNSEKKLVSWMVSLKDTKQFEDHKGIAKFELSSKSRHQRHVGTAYENDPWLWMVWPKDPGNEEETTETEKWLKSKVKDDKWKILTSRFRKGDDKGKVKLWSQVSLDEEGVKEAREYPGIRNLECWSQIYPARATFKPQGTFEDSRRHSILRKRASLQWQKEENAPKDLVMDSQWKGAPDLEKLNFVHEKSAGEDTFVYVIDEGVQVNVKNSYGENEFAHYNVDEFIQTGRSSDAGEKPDEDDDKKHGGHGTAVASKALGQKHGIAKGATLITAKLQLHPSGMSDAFEYVAEAIENNPERAKKSVVLMSMGFLDGEESREEALKSDHGRELNSLANHIIDLGVLIVLAAGNFAERKGREKIDSLPQILVSEDLPLINVGAATFAGEAAPFSQGTGTEELTVFAPGVDIDVLLKDGRSVKTFGTSFAAPIVAGIIATYMNYDTPPWGPQEMNKDRVKAIKRFLQTDASSWERKQGVRVIWNGADEDAHKAAGSNCKRDGQGCTGQKPNNATTTCYGIENKHYINRDTISRHINEIFCPDATKQGKNNSSSEDLVRTYLNGTMEAVEMALDWSKSNTTDFTPSLEDCTKYMRRILDGCDTNSTMNNSTLDLKGGGQIEVDKVMYRWKPTALRQALAIRAL